MGRRLPAAFLKIGWQGWDLRSARVGWWFYRQARGASPPARRGSVLPTAPFRSRPLRHEGVGDWGTSLGKATARVSEDVLPFPGGPSAHSAMKFEAIFR